MAFNLPDGVSPNDIPGNRPEDVRTETIWDEAHAMLPMNTEEITDALQTILTTSRHEEFTNACWVVVNALEENAPKWLAAIHDAAVKMGEIEDPPEREYDREAEYDAYDDFIDRHEEW